MQELSGKAIRLDGGELVCVVKMAEPPMRITIAQGKH